ncbi:MAG: hypothetical protein H6742_11795 [Alphaproteobacteria bacterium]|nr:hypothetical protein [Alphaproteobacteria bacterium]
MSWLLVVAALVRGAAAQSSAGPGAVGQRQGCDVEIVDRTGKQARAADRALARTRGWLGDGAPCVRKVVIDPERPLRLRDRRRGASVRVPSAAHLLVAMCRLADDDHGWSREAADLWLSVNPRGKPWDDEPLRQDAFVQHCVRGPIFDDRPVRAARLRRCPAERLGEDTPSGWLFAHVFSDFPGTAGLGDLRAPDDVRFRSAADVVSHHTAGRRQLAMLDGAAVVVARDASQGPKNAWWLRRVEDGESLLLVNPENMPPTLVQGVDRVHLVVGGSGRILSFDGADQTVRKLGPDVAPKGVVDGVELDDTLFLLRSITGRERQVVAVDLATDAVRVLPTPPEVAAFEGWLPILADLWVTPAGRLRLTIAADASPMPMERSWPSHETWVYEWQDEGWLQVATLPSVGGRFGVDATQVRLWVGEDRAFDFDTSNRVLIRWEGDAWSLPADLCDSRNRAVGPGLYGIQHIYAAGEYDGVLRLFARHHDDGLVLIEIRAEGGA